MALDQFYVIDENKRLEKGTKKHTPPPPSGQERK